MPDHCSDHVDVGCFGCKSEFFEFSFALSQNIERSQPRFRDQFTQMILRERLAKIIYLVVVYAVFPKQRRKIAARRSGGLFVDGYFVAHRL